MSNAAAAAEATDLLPGQNLAHLLPPSWKEVLPQWFAEDTPSFDWAGFVVGEEEQEAILWGKSGVSAMSRERSERRAASLGVCSERGGGGVLACLLASALGGSQAE